MQAKAWFDNIKLGQAKYLKENSERLPQSEIEPAQGNLAIDNRFKAILAMDYDESSQKLRVVENAWKKAVENFQSGMFAQKKYGK